MSGGVIAFWVLFLILRSINASNRDQASPAAAAAPKPVSTHPWYLGLLWLAALSSLIASLIAGATMEGLGWLWALPAVWLFVLSFPDFTARRLLAPTGCPRLAYLVTTFSFVGEAYDLRGRAALHAALAVLADKDRPGTAIRWIEERMKRDTPVRGAGLVAVGVLALARGDRDEARRLFEGIEEVDPRILPGTAARLASDWLVADAAASGKWLRVRRLAWRGVHTASRWARFVGRAASAILRLPDSPGRFSLVVRWLLTPCRARNWPLLRRACARIAAGAATAGPRRPEERPRPATDGSTGTPPLPLDRALLAHEALLGDPRPRKGALRAAGSAWRSALGRRETLRWAMERATSLEASSGESILRGLERSVCDDLAAILRRSGRGFMALSRDEGPLGAAARQVRDEILSELELACQAISGRVEQKRALAPADEWREWQALRDAAERAFRQGGDRFRRLAFPTFHTSVTSLACWLYNKRHETSLANAMFRWLHRQACAVEDDEAKKLQRTNMGCSL